MKKIGLWSIVGLVLIVGIAIFSALQMGEKSPMLVSGRIKVAANLSEKAKGAGVLFITIFDADSPMPMPYGAMRETLKSPIDGGGYEFFVTPERIQQMMEGRPQPAALRVKARLDMDGMGGVDQPGDLTGQIDRTSIGTENVEILISTEVQ